MAVADLDRRFYWIQGEVTYVCFQRLEKTRRDVVVVPEQRRRDHEERIKRIRSSDKNTHNEDRSAVSTNSIKLSASDGIPGRAAGVHLPLTGSCKS
jgi:hypothetical protein